MELAPTQFTSIEGTLVRVSVDTDAEAKLALKELRQKKKEYVLIRRDLLRQKKDLAALVKREAAARAKLKRQRGLIATIKKVADAFDDEEEKTHLATVLREISRTDDIMHGLDMCIVQIQGKLLRRG